MESGAAAEGDTLPLVVVSRRRDGRGSRVAPVYLPMKPPRKSLLQCFREWITPVQDQDETDKPGRKEINERVARECLDYYNAAHPGSEYELAPGEVIEHSNVALHNNSGIWTHGNFMARRKRTGCFRFLPGPRTVFFYELAYSAVVTCIPLEDEPVNDVCGSLCLGFWQGKCRSGKLDRVCRTCGYRLYPPLRLPMTAFPCGHQQGRPLCGMCFDHSTVLHPSPGKFQCGHQEDCVFSTLYASVLFSRVY